MHRLLAAIAALVCLTSAATAQFVPIGSGGYGVATYTIEAGPSGEVYSFGTFPGLASFSLVRLDASGVQVPVPPGPAGRIGYMAVSANGVLYAGGYDSMAIGRWDGARWTQLPNLSPTECSGCIDALTVGPDGSLYLAGRIPTPGSANVPGVWRYDGAAWARLGGPMDGRVRTVAVAADGSVYAGGLFTTAGGVAARRIARWDGAAWSALGSGTDRGVQDVAIGLDGSVYAGGSFATAGGVAASGVARWDGAAWHALGSGIPTPSSAFQPVEALALAADGSLVAAGAFLEAGGVAASNVARWDGTAWQPIGDGLPDRVFQLGALPDGGLVTVSGSVGYSRWNGAAWSEPGGPDTDARVRAVASASGPSAAFVGGDFTAVGGLRTKGVASWSPSLGWRPLGSGIDGSVSALALLSPTSLYAGGTFATAGGSAAANVARWTGSAWSALGAGTDGAVRALALMADGTLIAGGSFTAAGGTAASHIARWDGTAWAPLGAGLDGPVYAVAVGPAGSLYAGGDFAMAGGAPARHVARWDGTAWTPLGAGTDAAVRALTIGLDGSLYAGGDFTTAGAAPARHVARWSGAAWSALGSGTDAPVRALGIIPPGQDPYRFPAGTLLVGGDFATAGGAAAQRLARWDGSVWAPLGAGVTGASVDALGVGPSPLIVFGGDFTGTAEGPSPFVAALLAAVPVAEAPEPAAAGLALSVGPNPTRGAATAFVTAEAPAAVEVFDALGRRVARAAAAAGERVAVALPTERLAPGVYVVRLVAGDRVRTARLVVVR